MKKLSPPSKYTLLSPKERIKLNKIIQSGRPRLTPRNIFNNFNEILTKDRDKIPLENSIEIKPVYTIEFEILSENTPFVPYIENNGDLIVERHIEISTPIKSVFCSLSENQKGKSTIYDFFYLKINEYYINKFRHGKKRKDPEIPIPAPIDNLKCRELYIKYYKTDDYNNDGLYGVLSGQISGILAINILWNFIENNILINNNENEFIKTYLPDFYKRYESILIEKISTISSNFD